MSRGRTRVARRAAKASPSPPMNIKSLIRTIPDWPRAPVRFRDISSLLRDAEGFGAAMDMFIGHYRDRPIDVIAGLDARGFIPAAVLAYELRKPLVMVRKKGKLPGETIHAAYQLEYGSGVLEMQRGAGRIVLIDDVLATGGTMTAAAELCVRAGYQVSALATLIDLNIVVGYRWRDLAVRTVLSY